MSETWINHLSVRRQFALVDYPGQRMGLNFGYVGNDGIEGVFEGELLCIYDGRSNYSKNYPIWTSSF
jgi:hypothetical protein